MRFHRLITAPVHGKRCNLLPVLLLNCKSYMLITLKICLPSQSAFTTSRVLVTQSPRRFRGREKSDREPLLLSGLKNGAVVHVVETEAYMVITPLDLGAAVCWITLLVPVACNHICCLWCLLHECSHGSYRKSHCKTSVLTARLTPPCRSSVLRHWRHCSGRIRAPQQPLPQVMAGRLSQIRPRQRRQQQPRQHLLAASRHRTSLAHSGRRTSHPGAPPHRRPHSHSSRRRSHSTRRCSGQQCSHMARCSRATLAHSPHFKHSSHQCGGPMQMCSSRLSSRCSRSSHGIHSSRRNRSSMCGSKHLRSRSLHSSSLRCNNR